MILALALPRIPRENDVGFHRGFSLDVSYTSCPRTSSQLIQPFFPPKLTYGICSYFELSAQVGFVI